MKAIFSVILFMFCILSESHAQPSTMWQLLSNGEIIKWVYIGGDEFNDPTLDDSKWYTTYPWGRNAWGPYYNQEYPTNGQNFEFGFNSNVNSGTMKIIAKREDIPELGVGYQPPNYRLKDGSYNYQTWHYTTGMIFSKEKFKYGLFEISAKWPSGKGTFPAFWLFYGPPGDEEEIDIIEFKGETPNRYHIDTHCPNGCPDGEWVTTNTNLSTSFNTFRAEWGPGACIFSVNNIENAIYFDDLDYQMHIITNFAIAGPGTPFPPGADATTILPTNMEINFIRVWYRLDCEQNITINNLIQSETDETTKTGKNIVVSNTTVNEDQFLKLIATESITLLPTTLITGSFTANIIECPIIQTGDGPYINNEESTIRKKELKSTYETEEVKNTSADTKAILYVKITPNPARDVVLLEFDGTTKVSFTIGIFNNMGQSVFSKLIDNTDKLEIDCSKFPRGVYFLRGVFANSKVEEKFILN